MYMHNTYSGKHQVSIKFGESVIRMHWLAFKFSDFCDLAKVFRYTVFQTALFTDKTVNKSFFSLILW